MKMRMCGWLLVGFALVGAACSSKDDDREKPESEVDAVTYWSDVAPIFEQRCLSCHQEGGLGPFRLDDYESAKAHATGIRVHTQARTMPPYLVTADGSCGEFQDSHWLSDDELTTIANWVKAGAPKGDEEVEVTTPALPKLDDATVYATPTFTPEPEGSVLAEHDEYRCFLLDSGVDSLKFITAYDVEPGLDAVVHHTLAMIVDPDAPASLPEQPGLTNLELMEALDADSPDRDGWPCFGMAGDGVEVRDVPTTWAPGEGMVTYPGKSGIALKPTDKIVIQVHYNLEDESQHGKSVQTKVKFRLEDSVENIGFFVLSDPFLGSLLSGDMPDVLPSGESSVPYSWKKDLADYGLDQVPGVKLYGVFPHMHERGRKYSMKVSSGGKQQCAADVQNWDFHWQHMYFYEKPFEISADTAVNITCDYDTSADDAPTYPGWGTRNEMCFVALYFTAPIQ